LGKTSLTSSLFYRLTDDAITNYTILREDSVTETTFINLAKSTSYGLELTAAHPLFEFFRLNGSFSYFNTNFESPEISTNDNSWIGKLTAAIFLSKDFNLQFNANYNSPMIFAQGKIKEVFSADFAAKKDFFDGQLSLTFRVSDIFNTRKWDSETTGSNLLTNSNFFTTSYRKMESQVAFLGITYRLSSGKNNKERERQRPEDGGIDEF
jgi:iron complex outermembrane receptor protein